MEEKNKLQDIFIFAIFATLFIMSIFIIKPFFTVLLWTTLIYVLLRSLHSKFESKINKKKKNYNIKRYALAAGFAIGTLVLIIGPLTFLAVMLVQQATDFLSFAEQWVKNDSESFFEGESIQRLISGLESMGLHIPEANFEAFKDSFLEVIHAYSSKLFAVGKTVVNTTASFIAKLALIVFSLYFCFLDGKYLASLIKKTVPIKPEHMKILTEKFSQIIKNLFAGYILVALYQGIISFIIMLIFKVSGALLLSVLLMLSSFIPILGSAIVWVPVGIAICVTSSIVRGIIFLALCAICISLLENFLRPMFLKDRIQVHPLVVFFAILGGVQLFGMNGLILGPLVIILFFTALDLIVSKETWQNEQNLPSAGE